MELTPNPPSWADRMRSFGTGLACGMACVMLLGFIYLVGSSMEKERHRDCVAILAKATSQVDSMEVALVRPMCAPELRGKR